MAIFYLKKKDVEKILETINKFQNGNDIGENFQFEILNHGIGSSLDMIITAKVHDVTGNFRVNIFGSDEW